WAGRGRGRAPPRRASRARWTCSSWSGWCGTGAASLAAVRAAPEVGLPEAALGVAVAEQQQLAGGARDRLCAVAEGAVLVEDGDDVAAGAAVHLVIAQRAAHEGGGTRHEEQLVPLGDEHAVAEPGVVPQIGRTDRRVGEDPVGAGAIERGDVALIGGARDDLQLGAQAPAEQGEVDVEVIVARGDQDR